MVQEFEEIGHSGGQIIFGIKTNAEGRRSYQVTFTSSRPVPLVMIAVYALPQGVPVETIQLGGVNAGLKCPLFAGIKCPLIAGFTLRDFRVRGVPHPPLEKARTCLLCAFP